MRTVGTKYVTERADAIQDECHATVERIMGTGKKVSVEAAINVFIFQKLAEYELTIEELQRKVQDLEDLPASEFQRGQNK